MAKKPKYKNLSELAAAFASGELNKAHYKLVLDNDCSWLQFCGPLPEGIDEESDAGYSFRDERTDECRSWFEGRGYADLSAACTAAGIPNEWR